MTHDPRSEPFLENPNGRAAPTVYPSIAVVITAFNARRTIAAAIESAVAQDYLGSLSVVVVDDGSEDGTADVAEALRDERVTVLRPGRIGRARALNLALSSATGSEYVANLDADDLMLPGRLDAQARILAAHPECGVVGSAYLEGHVGPDGDVRYFSVTPPTDPVAIKRSFAYNFPICHSVATYRRDLAVQLGGFNPLLGARIDYDLWLRMAVFGYEVRNASDTLGVHFKHKSTFYGRKFSTVSSAVQMARLNFIAVQRLALGARGIAGASARLGYSLMRRNAVKATPRFSTPVDYDAALAAYGHPLAHEGTAKSETPRC